MTIKRLNNGGRVTSLAKTALKGSVCLISIELLNSFSLEADSGKCCGGDFKISFKCFENDSS